MAIWRTGHSPEGSRATTTVLGLHGFVPNWIRRLRVGIHAERQDLGPEPHALRS
jgi:hypothetical protein